MFDSIAVSSWFIPVLFVLFGIIAGLIVEKIVLVKVGKIASRTRWNFDDVIVNSLRGMVLLWFVAGGSYLALSNAPVGDNTVDVVGKAISVALIFSVTTVTARIVSGFVTGYLKNIKGALQSTTLFTTITLIIIYLLGILVILQYLGVSVAPILTALGVGGLAAALALQDTLSNLFSGIHLIASEKVRPGDYIKLSSGEEGYIADINWRNTTICALANNMIIVPNSKLASSIVTNFHRPEEEMSVLIQVGVSYDSDLARVEQVTKEVARAVMGEVDGAIPAFEPFIRYHTFGDFSIDFTVILRAREYVNRYLIKHEFIKKLHNRYKKEGIEIPFPVRTLYVRQEETDNDERIAAKR
ncbi:MAG: mechanosensitive ion channel family protein [Deltaproteobacteria bacterium]|nr:mechanosensitive ion channel family protein [Candidatus Zymogenaceae bacterium]